MFFHYFQGAAELLSRHPALLDTWKCGCSSVWVQHVVAAHGGKEWAASSEADLWQLRDASKETEGLL